jgi:integrase
MALERSAANKGEQIKMLTTKRVAALISARERGRFLDHKGLSLQISETGAASYVFRFTSAGRERWAGLGPADEVSLDDARAAAAEFRAKLRRGVDPIEDRRSARDSATRVTFAEAVAAYHEQHKVRWGRKTSGQFLSSMKDYAKPLSKMPVQAIMKADVLRVLRPRWLDRTETMTRVRSRIEAVLNFATGEGWRPEGLQNPAEWKLLMHVLPKPAEIPAAAVKHFPALPYKELPAFMITLGAINTQPARALELTIICATRTSETLHAKFSEIDFEEAVWTLPPERTKSGRALRIPLPDRALSILKTQRQRATDRNSEYIFPGRRRSKPMAADSLLQVLKDMKRTETVHGMRSSFRDYFEEETSFPRELSEMSLSHQVGDATERAYRRGDALEKRRVLMKDWSSYLYGQLVEEGIGTNVTKISERKRSTGKGEQR